MMGIVFMLVLFIVLANLSPALLLVSNFLRPFCYLQQLRGSQGAQQTLNAGFLLTEDEQLSNLKQKVQHI